MITIPKNKQTTYQELRGMAGVARPRHGEGTRDALDHHILVDTIKKGLKAGGYGMSSSVFTVSNDFCTIAGVFQLRHKDLNLSADYTPYLGFMNSNAGNRSGPTSLRFCIGGLGDDLADSPFVWEPLEQVGKNVFDSGIVCDYLSKQKGSILDMGKEIRRMKNQSVCYYEFDTVLMEAGRQKLMPWSRIGRVDAILNRTNQKTMWDLTLAFGQVTRMNPPLQQLEQLSGFAELLDA